MYAALILVFIVSCFALPMLYDDYKADMRRQRNRGRNMLKYEHAHRCCSCDGKGHGFGWNKEFDCYSCNGTGLHIFKSSKSVSPKRNHEWTRKIV
jgi:DnaJ-class molecular chaperone